MPRYRITSTEVVETIVEIVADNEDSALDEWETGAGELIDTNIFQPEIELVVELSD